MLGGNIKKGVVRLRDDMKITIGGYPGSGKTTVANALAEKLRLKHYYMGAVRRKAAKQHGMTLEEFNKVGETEIWTDKVADDILVKIGKEEDDFVAEGRVAYHFIPDSIKILITVDVLEGARRIHKDQHEKGMLEERNEEALDTVEEKAKNLQVRIDSDKLRYEKHYGTDCYDSKNFDLIIDSTNMTPEEVISQILEFLGHTEQKRNL